MTSQEKQKKLYDYLIGTHDPNPKANSPAIKVNERFKKLMTDESSQHYIFNRADKVSFIIGDTFIESQKETPQEQWEKIIALLHIAGFQIKENNS